MKFGADVNAQTRSLNTPLMYALRAGCLAIANILLRSPGIKLDIQNTKQQTALHLCTEDMPEMVTALLKAGASANICNEN